jgi:DUF2934 family protein
MGVSSKPKRNLKAQPQATSAQAGESSVAQLALEEEIRHREYELYLERGELPGCELDDWLQAERELARLALAQAS